MKRFTHTMQILLAVIAAISVVAVASDARATGGEEGHHPEQDNSEFPGEEGHQPTDDGSENGGEEGHHPVDGLGGEEGHRPVGLEAFSMFGALQLNAMTAPDDDKFADLFGQLGGANEDGRPEYGGAANPSDAFDCADTGFSGACWGDQLAFCDSDGIVQVDDCAAAGQACGFAAADGWYDCVDASDGVDVDSTDAQLSDWTDLDVLAADGPGSAGCSGSGGDSGLPVAAAMFLLTLGVIRRRA